MSNPTAFKQQLIEKYEDTRALLQRLAGAIEACSELEKAAEVEAIIEEGAEEETTEEEETTDA